MDDTPTAAADELISQSIAPSTPAAAAAKLKELEADRQWGERLQRGDDATRREFIELTTLAAGGDGPPVEAVDAILVFICRQPRHLRCHVRWVAGAGSARLGRAVHARFRRRPTS